MDANELSSISQAGTSVMAIWASYPVSFGIDESVRLRCALLAPYCTKHILLHQFFGQGRHLGVTQIGGHHDHRVVPLPGLAVFAGWVRTTSTIHRAGGRSPGQASSWPFREVSPVQGPRSAR